MNAALILAGGIGERLSSDVPKQFIPVNGKPIIKYALQAFENCADIGLLVIVVAESWREELLKWLKRDGVSKFTRFANPGRTRQHSIYNGLLSLCGKLGDSDKIIIHDAVRPLVAEADISRCIGAAEGYDGATPALSVNDATYKSEDGKTITALLNRDELFMGQTPECYNFAKYLAAHQNLTDDEIGVIRGSSEIAFKEGMKIRLFAGTPQNIKITTKTDLLYFCYLLENRE